MIESVQRLLAEPIPLGGLLSLLSGLAAALWTWHTSRTQERKRYTFNVLMSYANSAELLRALDEVNRSIGGVRLSASHLLPDVAASTSAAGTPAASTSAIDAAAIAASRERSMALLLPYFQSIALAASQGMLDRDVLLKARYGTMKAVWDHFSADIEAKRVALARPLLYCDLESYLKDNERRYKRYQRRQAEQQAAAASQRASG